MIEIGATEHAKPVVKMQVLGDYGYWLYGVVFGHPRFDDGQDVTTSLIVRRRGKTVETLNTIYELIEDNESADEQPF